MSSCRRLTVALVLLAISAGPLAASRSTLSRPANPLPSSTGTITATVTTVSGDLITVLDGRLVIDAAAARIETRSGRASIMAVRPGVRIQAWITNSEVAPGTPLQASLIVVFDLPDATVTGRITTIDDDMKTITISALVVDVPAGTPIKSGRETLLPFSALRTGDLASVDVRVTDGGLVAEEIRVAPSVASISISGVVSSIGPEEWVITDREGRAISVRVDDRTRIDSTAIIGSSVVVFGERDVAGNFIASAIQVVVSRPGIMFFGTVKSVSLETWVITRRDGTDVTVVRTPQTLIDRGVTVGSTVKVTAIEGADGALIALSITHEPPPISPPPPPTLTRFEGTVRAIGPDQWLVDETRVVVSRATRIVGEPDVGDQVLVTGSRLSDGRFAAVIIEKR